MHPYIVRVTSVDRVGYGLSVVALVGGGVAARSAVLNWIVGPLIVVIVVSGTNRVVMARRLRRGRT